MSNKSETIMIDDVKYIREDSAQAKQAPEVDGMKYCVIRTYSAGVHIGYVKEFGEKYPQQATLLSSRRLYQWNKACSLSQVAMDGLVTVRVLRWSCQKSP